MLKLWQKNSRNVTYTKFTGQFVVIIHVALSNYYLILIFFCQSFNIRSYFFIKDGEVKDKTVGAVTKAQLEEKIKALL